MRLMTTHLEWARNNDRLVHEMLGYGATLEEIIAALVVRNNALMEKCVSLESIAPKRVRMPNGQEVIWQCPSELIPIS